MPNLVTQRFVQCHDLLKSKQIVKSSRQFAIQLDFAPQSLNDILKGKRDVTVELCRKAVCKFNVSAEYLFCGEGPMLKEMHAANIEHQAVLTVVTDHLQKEKIVHVPIAAQAGYGGSLTDITYFKELPAFSLPDPRFQYGTHRCFDVSGSSMEPGLSTGDRIICTFVDTDRWQEEIRDHMVYVIVTKSDVLVKRVVNKIDNGKYIELHSDNKSYQPFEIQLHEIVEIWKVVLKISPFSSISPNASSPFSKEFDVLRETVDSQSNLIEKLNGTINALLKQHRSRS